MGDNQSSQDRRKRKLRNSRLLTVGLVLVFIAGLCIMLYPTVSDYWNSLVQSRVIDDYNQQVSNLSDMDYSAYFEAADEYNRKLYALSDPLLQPELVEGYHETLDITGSGIMGYITIEKIDASMPIYHTTDEAVLQVAAGHMYGTSLPVGGANTHCVLSAHRGLPSARLFTDLDKLEVGDRFVINVLNRAMTYEVDQIRIVLPEEMEELAIVPNGDYCTLMTCTPYGINSHRMLVRGVRVQTDDKREVVVFADARTVDRLVSISLVAIPLLLVLMVVLWIVGSTRRHTKKHKTKK